MLEKNDNIAIEVSNFTKRFKSFVAVNNISLKISKGSFHAICGENGSGKTTLVRSIIGAYPNSSYSGIIKVNKQMKISYIPEVAIFPSGKKVSEFLLDVAHFMYEDRNEAKLMVEKSLIILGIQNLYDKKANKLSSGQKKKVMLSRIYIENPDIVILDEPTSNLDFNSRNFVFEKLNELNKQDKTIIIISHMVKEVQEYVNECSLIHYGNLLKNDKIEINTLSSVYSNSIEKFKKLNSLQSRNIDNHNGENNE
jgi:ABC-2 type transport system ATP-binding protein